MDVPLYSLQDLNTIATSFYKELQRSEHITTSLACLKNPLSTQTIKNEDVVQVLSIGGSYCKTAYAKTARQGFEFLEEEITPLPIFTTKGELLSFIRQRLKQKTTVLALNFAYPLKAILREGRTDGVLIKSTKEHAFMGLINEPVGATIEQDLAELRKQPLRVLVANDTVCLALAGLHIAPWDQIVGGIVGTGTNFGFFSDKDTIINSESGNFDAFKQTASGEYIDTHSVQPGSHRFEKEVSGAYLYLHYNYYALQNPDGIPPLNSTAEISLIQPHQTTQYAIAQKLLERSASLIAAEMSALFQYLKRPALTFIMEGSLFWDNEQYLSYVTHYLHALKIPLAHIRFEHLKNSNLLGAAYLAYGVSS